MTKIVAAFARPSTGRTELSASGMVWLQNAILSEFESPHRSGGGRPPVDSRGVAQPGRAPGSGPGGRRFKSSLPDQSFQTLKQHFWFSVYSDGVEIVDGRVFLDFPLGFHRELQPNLLARTRLSLPGRTSMQGHCLCPRPFFATDGRSVGHSFSPHKITVIQ